MSFLHLTAGAERVLANLRKHSQDHLPTTPLSWRLLSGLLEEEGHAAELLRGAGITPAAFPAMPDSSSDSPDANSTGILDWQRTLVRRADRYAIDGNADSMTGTEHLLLALISLEPVIAEFCERFQLTAGWLEEAILEPSPPLIGPDEALLSIAPAGHGTVDQAAMARILDASANRCREGLRVIEDYVRFHLNDAVLQRALKEIRHQLTQALRHLGQERWIRSRDSLQDVGPSSTLTTERARGSLVDVIRANLKRVQESLRSLEEYGKLIDAEPAQRIAECRYRIYTVEKTMETRLLNRRRLETCRLYLLVTAAGCRYSPEITIRNALEKGVDIIQIREKQMSDRELIAYGQQVREWTTAAGALLIINDRPDIAAAVNADGVHLGQEDQDVSSARRILGGTGLIGVSTHSLPQAEQALFDGADYLGVGPVFQTATKEFTEYAGLEYVQQAAMRLSIPWFAIGGITTRNLKALLNAGATRVAVSSAICQAPDPRGVTDEFRRQLAPTSLPGDGEL